MTSYSQKCSLTSKHPVMLTSGLEPLHVYVNICYTLNTAKYHESVIVLARVLKVLLPILQTDK